MLKRGVESLAGSIKRLGFVAAGVCLASCGRIDDAQPGPSSGGGAGFSAGGGAGQPTIDVTPLGGAPDAGLYPSPFDKSTCSAPVSPYGDGALMCLTRAQLQDMKPLRIDLDGGVSALGPPGSWRCPELSELSTAGPCGGEGSCCYSALCGPLLERSSSASSEAGSAGALGDGGTPPDPQQCCYYVEESCGV
jgi:hypothetical protein